MKKFKVPTIDELLENFVKDKSIKDIDKKEIVQKFRKIKLQKIENNII